MIYLTYSANCVTIFEYNLHVKNCDQILDLRCKLRYNIHVCGLKKQSAKCQKITKANLRDYFRCELAFWGISCYNKRRKIGAKTQRKTSGERRRTTVCRLSKYGENKRVIRCFPHAESKREHAGLFRQAKNTLFRAKNSKVTGGVQ